MHLQGSPMPSPRDPQGVTRAEAQKRYRQKKKDELNSLKMKAMKLEQMEERLRKLEPFDIYYKINAARHQAGKIPKMFVYRETFPEWKIIDHYDGEKMLGYDVKGRDCWEYKRFPGVRDEEKPALRQRWDKMIDEGGYKLYHFLDQQYFQRMCYRDGKVQWRWGQMTCERDMEAEKHLTKEDKGKKVLCCIEHDVHDQVTFGMRKGVEDYLSSAGAGSHCAYAEMLKHNSYLYQVTLGKGEVTSTAPEAMQILKWDMMGMPIKSSAEGTGIPPLDLDKEAMKDFIQQGGSKKVMRYQRMRMKNGTRTMIDVEAWARVLPQTDDGSDNPRDVTIVEILERAVQALE